MRPLAALALAALAAACNGSGARPSPSPPSPSPSPSPPASPEEPATATAPALTASASAAPDPLPPWPPAPPVGVATDWCTDSVVALDEETCFVLPDARTPIVLVYLHGLVPPETESRQKTDFQRVVANASRRAGVAALVPRGRKGMASAPREAWWGWPTGPRHYASHASALVERIEAAQRKLEGHVGAPFTQRHVVGSSSGAYFTTLLAFRGGIAADGFAATSGGSVPQGPRSEGVPKRPFYIGYGTLDAAAPRVRELAAFLERGGWPVRLASHPTGHGAREIYLDEAFAFFAEERAR